MKLLRFVVTVSLVVVLVPMRVPEASVAGADQLEFIGSFETLQSLGFTPDGITYSPQGARLMIAASSDSGVGQRGVFEVTQDGRLVDSFATGILGFGITRATSGPKVGHFFVPDFNGLPTITVYEFDPGFTVVNSFTVTGSGSPGTGIAFNHFTQNLVVADGGTNELIEVTASGDPVRIMPLAIHADGITFNQATGTYFIVNNGPLVAELSSDGELLRTFDVSAVGVKAGVGIASGQNKFFIADEGDPANSSGTIFIFKAPQRQP